MHSKILYADSQASRLLAKSQIVPYQRNITAIFDPYACSNRQALTNWLLDLIIDESLDCFDETLPDYLETRFLGALEEHFPSEALEQLYR